MSALHALVSGILDYAGLYPPASLPMTEAASSLRGLGLLAPEAASATRS